MSGQSGKVERHIYPAELKQEALRLVLESGLSNSQAGKGLAPGSLNEWLPAICQAQAEKHPECSHLKR